MTGHLVHIGFAKTGSSLLRRWFAAHPQLAYADGGIAGFDDIHAVARAGAAPPGDLRFRVTSSEGLATPTVNFGRPLADFDRAKGGQFRDSQAEARDLLAALFPQAHILIVTRGFRSVMLSGYSQYVRTGGTDMFFALRPGFGADDHRARDAWDYCGMISLYREKFGDRVIHLPWELMRDDPETFVRLIEERLGLDHFPLPRREVNRGLTPVELAWYPRISRLVNRLPLGRGRVRRFTNRLYLAGSSRNALKPLVRLLQAVAPAAPVSADAIPPEVLERCRRKSACLKDDPLYAPYAADYLF